PVRILSGNGVHRFRNHCSTSPEYAAGTEPMICDQTPSVQDVTLMDLKRWVEAAGGKLQLNVEMPNGSQISFAV
ncbi:hypothetical protein NUK31_22075, partial [Aeromonas caviae]|nr:hypothetical protein [Aeromonas caviae]